MTMRIRLSTLTLVVMIAGLVVEKRRSASLEPQLRGSPNFYMIGD